jgi:hypothetical protein
MQQRTRPCFLEAHDPEEHFHFEGLHPTGNFSKDFFAVGFIGNQTSTRGCFFRILRFYFDEIKQTLVHMNSYRNGVKMTLQSYTFPISKFFISYKSNMSKLVHTTPYASSLLAPWRPWCETNRSLSDPPL